MSNILLWRQWLTQSRGQADRAEHLTLIGARILTCQFPVEWCSLGCMIWYEPWFQWFQIRVLLYIVYITCTPVQRLALVIIRRVRRGGLCMLAPVCFSLKVCECHISICYMWSVVAPCVWSWGSSFSFLNAGTSLRGLLLPEGMTLEPSVWTGNLLAVRTGASMSHVVNMWSYALSSRHTHLFFFVIEEPYSLSYLLCHGHRRGAWTTKTSQHWWTGGASTFQITCAQHSRFLDFQQGYFDDTNQSQRPTTKT